MIACAAVTIICFKEVEPVREPIVNRQPHIDLFFQASLFSTTTYILNQEPNLVYATLEKPQIAYI